MPEKSRVFVTGVGVISAIGCDRESFWHSLATGKTGFSPLEPPPPDLGFSLVAGVRDFYPEKRFESRMHQTLDRNAQFALAAAGEAIRDAGIEFTPELALRTGVITGCGIGGSSTIDASYERLYRQGKTRASPLTVPNIMPSAGASHISMAHGLKGPSFTVSSACASSAHAIGLGLGLIRSGVLDVAVVGGHEAQLNPATLYAWDALRVVSPTVCRPFSADRDGMTLGEGAAMLVIESEVSVLARGGRSYAELAGCGMSADAGHLTAPSVEGPVGAIRAALEDAGMSIGEVDHINAHGTGTPGNDRTEAEAIREVFVEGVARIGVVSTKALHGHTIGAAGAVEAVASVLALDRQTVPVHPTGFLPDPEIELAFVDQKPENKPLRAALSHSFAFGGLNAVLAFRRAPREF